MASAHTNAMVRFGLGERLNLTFLIGDITEERCDAIVNAANSSLMGGGGVDGAIHDAGGASILEECIVIVRQNGPLPPGQAVITTGGALRSKHVIHTVGPVWQGGDRNEPTLLSDCYRNSLLLADRHNLSSIAFPSISPGAFRYPVRDAARIAVGTIMRERVSLGHIVDIRFVLFDPHTHKAYVTVARNLLQQNS